MSADIADATWISLVLAPFVGSFLATVVVRMPHGESVALGRSHCRACGHQLAPVELLPLLSWLWLRGRCRVCGSAIGALYPAVEVATFAVAAWSLWIVDGWQVWASCALGWTLLTLAAIDWRDGVLPDVLTLPLAAGGLAMAAAGSVFAITDHLLGAAAGFAAFAGISLVYRWIRHREGLGLGDAKLLAAAGAWLTWRGLPSVVLIAAVSALLVVGGRALLAGERPSASQRLPFGPYLCLGIWLTWLYGPLSWR